ncbi:hypothetical protein KI387_003172 [Taxus chinensis]|uniref:ABC transporter domain-containing protein n=1 Tax=Taxus chinensis TaxID=29808 RepID=A0AA38GXX7_TAXCH|nr:hypothetical protein KI387_003172 [Taxus chinensis]
MNDSDGNHAVLEIEQGNSRPQVVAGGLSPLSETLWKEKTDTKGIGDVSARLTWQDLCVIVSVSGGETQTVLQGLTGYAEPGNLMALMGPSGSGKSTLLDALAGRLAANAFQTGSIKLNGRKQKLSFGTAAYVTQDDTLIGTLTVRETIAYSARLRLPDKMPWSEKTTLVESTLVEMGLQECADTPIGNWHLRGISGGEKRRVSIALEILMRPRLLFLDEPTSGLDRDGRTVIASVHQPSSEVFELFDSLYLLSGGKTVYFGKASEACEFFQQAGFPCPPFRNPSDHFLRCINSDFDKVKATLKGSMKMRIERSDDPLEKITTSQAILTLVEKYQFSQYHQAAVARVQEISQIRGTVLDSGGSQASFLDAVFHVNTCFSEKRLNGHYGVVSFVVGNTLSGMPFLLTISIISGTICYYMVRLHPGFSHYVFFLCCVYMQVLQWVESLMMAIASVVPNFLMGIIIGAGIQGIFMLVSGYFRLPKDIPKPVWRYPMSYISFHYWALQGQYQNDLFRSGIRQSISILSKDFRRICG